MKTLRLLITRGVALPGGRDAFPGETHEVEERFARSLLFDGRAVAATDVVGEPELDQIEDPEAEVELQERDPRPMNRDPKPRRQGPRR